MLTMSNRPRPLPFIFNPRSLLAGLLALGAIASSAHGEPAPAGGYHHRFQHAEHWAQVFDDPSRDRWQKPEQVIATLQLRPDAKVADIGAGTGYFTMRLARQVTAGKVYAIDVEPDMVAFLERRAGQEKLGNVRAVLADEDNPKIPEPVDLIFVCDTYHHIGNRSGYFRRLRASLSPAGRIVIVDFYRDKPTPAGPPPRFRVDPSQVIEEMKDAGFRLVRQDDGLDYQYILFFEAQAGNGPVLPEARPGKP